MATASYLIYMVFLLGLNTFLKTISVANNELCQCPSTNRLSWKKSLEFCQSFKSTLAHYNNDPDDFKRKTCLFGTNKYWTGRYMIETPWIEIKGCYKEDKGMQYDEVFEDTDIAVCFAYCKSYEFFGIQNSKCMCLSPNTPMPILNYGDCYRCNKNRYLCGKDGSVAVYGIASMPVKPDKNTSIKCASVSCQTASSLKPWIYVQTGCNMYLKAMCVNQVTPWLSTKYISWFNASIECHQRNSYLAGANEAAGFCNTNAGRFWTHIHKEYVIVNSSFQDKYPHNAVSCEYISFTPDVKLSFGNCDDIQGFACSKSEDLSKQCAKASLSSNEQVAVGVGVAVGVLVILGIVLVIYFRERRKRTEPKMPSFTNVAYVNNAVTDDAIHNQQQDNDNLGSSAKPTYEEIDINDMQVEQRTNIELEQSNTSNTRSNSLSEINTKSQNTEENNKIQFKNNYDIISDEIANDKKAISFEDRVSNQQDDGQHDYDKLNSKKSDANGSTFNYDHVPVGIKHSDDDDLEDYDHLQRSPRKDETLGSTYDHVHSVNYEDTYNTLNHATPSSPSDTYDHLPD